MVSEGLVCDVADYVLGFETDNEGVNTQIARIAQTTPVGWYGSLLWQFCLITALDYDPKTLCEETDERHVELLQRASLLVIPKLEVKQTKKAAFGMLNRTIVLTTREIASEFDDLLNALGKEFRARLGQFMKDGVAPRSMCYELKSDDPVVCCIALTIETELCRRFGFAQGCLAASNLHGMARLYLRLGPTAS